MTYNSVIAWAIIGVIACLLLILVALITNRKWLQLLATIFTFCSYPILFFSTSSAIENDHLRLWVGFLVVLLAPYWLITVFYIGTFEKRRKNATAKSASPLAIRIRGLIVLGVGVAAWFYGAFHSSIPTSQESTLLAVAIYGILLGSYWSISGRKIRE